MVVTIEWDNCKWGFDLPDKVFHVEMHFCKFRLAVAISAGKVRFGSGSGPLALNAEPEPGVRFRQPPNLEPERGFRFGSAFERVRTRSNKKILTIST